MPDTDKMLAKTLNLKLARIIRDNDRRTNNSDSDGPDDFVPINGTSMVFKFRCGECNQLHESRIYERIVYAYTTYSNREPVPKWHCPKHPRAEVKKTWTPMVDNVSSKRE